MWSGGSLEQEQKMCVIRKQAKCFSSASTVFLPIQCFSSANSVSPLQVQCFPLVLVLTEAKSF